MWGWVQALHLHLARKVRVRWATGISSLVYYLLSRGGAWPLLLLLLRLPHRPPPGVGPHTRTPATMGRLGLWGSEFHALSFYPLSESQILS